MKWQFFLAKLMNILREILCYCLHILFVFKFLVFFDQMYLKLTESKCKAKRRNGSMVATDKHEEKENV